MHVTSDPQSCPHTVGESRLVCGEAELGAYKTSYLHRDVGETGFIAQSGSGLVQVCDEGPTVVPEVECFDL